MTNTWVHITRMIRMLIRKHDIAPVLVQLKLYILISSFLYILRISFTHRLSMRMSE